MAAPFVTGVGLLMRDARPALSPQTFGGKLRSTAVDWGLGGAGTDPGSRGPDLDFGWGRLDAYRALASVGARGLTNPPTPPAHRVLEGDFSATERLRDFPIGVTDCSRPP
jgi:serine protease AprX